jgi:hypothetical protein
MTVRPRHTHPRRLPSRRLAVAGVVVAAVTTTGVATAYWTAPGSGSGAATTGSAGPVTVGAGTPTAGLFPGGSADLALATTNPNPAPVAVRLELDLTRGTGGFEVDAAHPGCLPGSFTFQAPPGDTPSVPAGDGVVTLTDAVSMNLDAPDACQGVTITVYLRAAS